MPFDSDYKYIDHEYLYTDKDTGVLLNKENIKDYKELIAFESLCVANRSEQLLKNPIKIEYGYDLLKIHKFLFQDVYDWAGSVRKVEIAKGGRQFLPMHSFNEAFAYIDGLLSELSSIQKSDKKKIAEKLAIILDNINFLHPFREGNGRTQREFIKLLALQKGYKLNLNPIDNHSVYERYMDDTINGKVDDLTDLIYELLK
ncbi:MAG: Fic family protein [Alphaproteobacteria bacterium]|nr:Fic family protein [Alphaproteobacteria bacterium]